ncbi:MAG: cyclic nucleotide-binding domain-containing protein [Hyphomicrobiaceae bacterium]
MTGDETTLRLPLGQRLNTGPSHWDTRPPFEKQGHAMTLKSECNVMRELPLFKSIEEPTLKLIALSSTRLAFDPGDIVYEQGGVPDAVFLLMSGTVRVVQESDVATLEVARIVGPDVLGEIGVLCDRPRVATVIAIEPATMLRIDAKVFREMLSHTPQVALAIAEQLAKRLSAANERMLALSVSGSV